MNFTIDTTTNVLNSTAGIALTGEVFDEIGPDLPNHSLINPKKEQRSKQWRD